MVDIRDVRERRKLGFIPGSTHVPRGMLEFWLDPTSHYYTGKVDPTKRIIVYCAGGQRSALAADVLREMGFPSVAHLAVGFTGWAEAGRAVEQSPRVAAEAHTARMKRPSMKAAVFHGPQKPLTIENVEVAQPIGREVLVRTVASGVCHSDLHFVDGYYQFPTPAILGHEAAGIVESVGPHVTRVQAWRPRDRLPVGLLRPLRVLPDGADAPLSVAARSRAQEPPKLTWNGAPVNQFANLSAYAEKMLVHENGLVKVKNDMPLDRAALIGCGVTTGVGAVLNTARVEAGATVAVYGAGGVGLAVIQGARIAGAGMIIAVDVFGRSSRRRKELGATHTVDASEGDPVKAIREMTGGGVEYAFEAIGLRKRPSRRSSASARAAPRRSSA